MKDNKNEPGAISIVLIVVFLMAFGTFLSLMLDVSTKPAIAYHDVYYAVHVADTKGRKPVDYLSRHKLRGGTLVELPTLYQVRYHDNGKVEDIGIAYQPWWRK